MKSLLSQFWKWIGKTPEEYAKDGLEYVYNHMEFDYPEFEALQEFAYEIVNNNVTSYDEVYDLLTVMALDNEGEHVLDYIEEYSSNEQLEQIIEIGMSHLQSEARWQITELLYRRKPQNYLQCLHQLSNDTNHYVRKRALNCIEYLKNEIC